MSVEHLTDHEERLLSLLPSQFRSKPNITALLQIIAGQIQQLEDSAYQLSTLRALSVAEGAQLDGLGDILGETRQGRTDIEYRSALQVRIKINLSSGQPETLISVFSAITGATKVGYSEFYPSGAYLNSIGGSVPPNLLDNMYRIAPAGVELILTVSTATPFGFAGDADALGFGSTVDPAEGGELSGVVS